MYNPLGPPCKCTPYVQVKASFEGPSERCIDRSGLRLSGFPGVAHPADLLAGGDLPPAGGGDGGALPGGGGRRDGVPVGRREEDVLRLEIGVRQLAAIRSCSGPLGKPE